MQRVNYDLIAPLYDEPSRDHPVDAHLQRFLATRHSPSSPVRILDVGCGTGKQLAADRSCFPAPFMAGLDLFSGMLHVAQKRCPGVYWIQADGANLPFSAHSFDYITNQFSYPHIRQKEQMLAEVFRILCPGGCFAMTNIDPWSMPNWILYHFFPAARDLDFSSFLPPDRFTAILQTLGFSGIEVTVQKSTPCLDLAEFYAYATQRYRTSQLIAIPDQDYRNGLHLIETILQTGPLPVSIPSEFGLITITGGKSAA